jgi:gliding motility-associated protein GldE
LFTSDILFSLAAIVFLLVLSALVSGSEVALFSLKPKDLEELRLKEHKNDALVLDLLEKPRFLLSTILISNNLVNVSIIIIANFVLGTFISSNNQVLNLLINVVLLTSLLVFFGEVAPKVFATQNGLVLARFTASLLKFFRFLFYPLSWVLVKTGLIIEKKFQEKTNDIDLDEIEKAIELSSNSDSTKEDVAMLKGIVNFGNTSVRQVMTPRIDIVAIDIEDTFIDVMNVVKESGYSRMPVYKDSIDKIEGVLYIKDIIEHLDESENFEWQKLLREPMFVPETKKIDDLLKEIQESRKHLAVVVDEYGGTSGIVTLEDVIEEVVGEIKDEFDEDIGQEYKKINNNTFLFEGKILLNDVCKILEIDVDTFEDVRGESDTLAGLLLELFGEIPKKGDKISYENYNFTVLEVQKNRIQKVKIQIQNDAL